MCSQKSREASPSTLVHLFPSSTVLDVLALLILHSRREFYQREIAERTSSGVLQVQRALERIHAAGLLTRQRRGNRVYYRADREHPAFEDIRRMLQKTVGLGGALSRALAPMADHVRLAFIFGSLATGEETSRSDVDLMLVGDLDPRKDLRRLTAVGRELGREVNPVLFPPAELRAQLQAGNAFLQDVFRGPKIWLKGDEDELARMVG